MSDPILDDFDQGSVVQFIRDTRHNGVAPSDALKSFVGANAQLWDSNQDATNKSALTLQLIRLAYPEICDDIRFNIIDSNYPENTETLTHEAFDNLISERLKTHYQRAL